MSNSEDNELRAEWWVKNINEEGALLVIAIAQKDNGSIIIKADGRLDYLLIADALDGFAKSLRNKNIDTN